ncbi:MAG: universal stress protein [Pyrinomonadaceae bacterium]|nr:universal stress protein [Pyrinomonadaceae bacterium]
MKVLIGYDGSSYADAALNDLRLAGLPREGEALVVSVGDVLFTPPLASHEIIEKTVPVGRLMSAIELAQEQEMKALEEAEMLASEAVLRAQEYLPGWKVRSKALAGAPSQELIQEAELWKADLIMVGSRGRSALGRLFLGSVSKTAATEASSSVRIARRSPGKSADSPPRLVIGVDGSAGSERAVRAVGKRVWPEGTEVRVVAVDDGTSPLRIADVTPNPEVSSTGCNEESAVRASRVVAWALEELRAVGLRATAEIKEGDPQSVLIDEARKRGHCVFVGSRGMGSTEGATGLGRVSARLVTGAHYSVEVVR